MGEIVGEDVFGLKDVVDFMDVAVGEDVSELQDDCEGQDVVLLRD